MLRCFWLLALLLPLWLAASDAVAFQALPFSPLGSFYRPDHPEIPLGPGSGVEEIDGFVQPAGAASPTDLYFGIVPAGLSLSFSAALSADTTDLLLRYDFMNTSGSALAGLSLVSFVDAEIDEPINTFFNEYVEVVGTPGAGQSYEADEPGFTFGDIYANAQAGALDGTNATSAAAPDDVAMALALLLGPIAPGQIARFEILLSEDGESLGAFRLVQRDDASDHAITYSGAASIVPEPGTALLLAAGLGALGGARRRGRRA